MWFECHVNDIGERRYSEVRKMERCISGDIKSIINQFEIINI